MTERFETHTFTCDAETHLSILEPAPLPEQYGGPVYLVKHEAIRAKSKYAPLIIWGDALDDCMPFDWADPIGRAMAWKVPVKRLFDGTKISVRVGIFPNNDFSKRSMSMMRDLRVLQAVHVRDDKPSKEALQWLDEQIAERKGWFE